MLRSLDRIPKEVRNCVAGLTCCYKASRWSASVLLSIMGRLPDHQGIHRLVERMAETMSPASVNTPRSRMRR